MLVIRVIPRLIFVVTAFAALAGVVAWRYMPQLFPWGALSRISETVNELREPVAPHITTPGPLRAPVQRPGAALTRSGVVRWTNVFRSQADLKPLAERPQLTAAAEEKLRDMFARQYFAHDNPDGEGIATAVRAAGYAYLRVGENLALGNFPSDQALVEAWMASPGHRANILERRFTEIGVAVGEGRFQDQRAWLAVQVFALPVSACPAVDQALLQTVRERQVSLKTVAADIEQSKDRLDALRPEVESLAREIERLIAEGNAKTAEGNREIEGGNRVYQETGDREAAEPHWTRGEQLQQEGRQLHARARSKQETYNAQVVELQALVEATNEKVVAFNERQRDVAQTVEKVNAQIQAYNSCVGGA